MKLRRSAAAIAAIATLTLASCSSDGDDQAGSTPPATETTQEAADRAVEIGDALKLTGPSTNPYDADITIDNLVVSDQCHYGTNDYGGENDPEFGKIADDETYLQVWAELETHSHSNDGTVDAPEPQVVDDEGFTQSAARSTDCRNADDEYQLWGSLVGVGEKVRVYQAFTIPDNAVEMKLDDYRVELPDAEADGADPASPTPEGNEEAAAVEPTPARDYRCPQTDNYVTVPSQCETPIVVTDVPAPSGDLADSFPYAPYGRDENGMANIPDDADGATRCHIAKGVPCEAGELDPFIAEWG